jgi:hypothetical protein
MVEYHFLEMVRLRKNQDRIHILRDNAEEGHIRTQDTTQKSIFSNTWSNRLLVHTSQKFAYCASKL